MRRFILAIALIWCSATLAAAEPQDTSIGQVWVERMVDQLDEPWAMAFLPSGAMLITLRDGRLLLVAADGSRNNVSGVPQVFATGQGGLLDVVLARNFAETSEIFLTYSEPRPDGAGTALAVAKFYESQASLQDFRVIFRQNTSSFSKIHFGGRVVEAVDGTLLLTIGERGEGALAQAMDVHNGKVVRVNRDGSIPDDNPFIDNQLPEIWSLGHRNPQGAALDANGRYWSVEHGAMGGDEINHPEAGKNYGWPIISYGLNYNGDKIGIGTSADGMEQPVSYWDPSIAPSGLMIYSGKLFAEWAGDMFVGSLKFDMISRLEISGESAKESERLFQDQYPRIRDIREAPDGSIWFLSVGDRAAYRVSPMP